MKLMLEIPVSRPDRQIGYGDKILAIGSCFTEHIGGRMQQMKFPVLGNPNGILFDPLSVCNSLMSYLEPKTYRADDLIYLNELWQSWQHHSEFSGIRREDVLDHINRAQHAAHGFLKDADWLIITLGSSFSYQLAENALPVANCHRAPGRWFSKKLLSIEETKSALEACLAALLRYNPRLKVIFTISPVRHIRDGVVENNRSKARLLEAVHGLIDSQPDLHYFPAYEWVIDVLRDHRYYDIDLVHPNFAATQFVFEKFVEQFVSNETAAIMKEVQQIVTAANHKSFHPETQAHQQFRLAQRRKITEFRAKYPLIDLSAEEDFFSQPLAANGHQPASH